MKLKAKLRVGMSCEWIFKIDPTSPSDCPKCHWGHYGARYVYGKKAYQFAKSQKPWFDRKMKNYGVTLNDEIQKAMLNKPKFLEF